MIKLKLYAKEMEIVFNSAITLKKHFIYQDIYGHNFAFKNQLSHFAIVCKIKL
jgi:hypothetical protein